MAMRFRVVSRLLVLSFACGTMAACMGADDDGFVDIVVVGQSDDLQSDGVRLGLPGQLARAAVAEGLVTLDHNGEVVPALAERWIVTDDGLSYIFRLRNADWPDGAPMAGDDVRDALSLNLRQLEGTSLGLDLAKISDIRAMTGRVVEIRLDSPMPDLLQLLAQPELGIRHNGDGAGWLRSRESRDGPELIFSVVTPEERGLPEDPEWQDKVKPLRVFAMPAEEAVTAFEEGNAEVLLGGTLASFPLADTGPLARGTVRIDATVGLFGLEVLKPEGILANPAQREAIAMAIDRPALLAPLNIGGWTATTRIVGPGLPGDPGTIGERWGNLSIEDRRGEAARRVAGSSGARQVSLLLPSGPGSDLLLGEIRNQLSSIGIDLVRAESAAEADLRLIDRVARFAGPRWYLNQFNCGIRRASCLPLADALVSEAREVVDPVEQAALYAEAEAELTAANLYIPLGVPIRWSLIRGDVEGFSENAWAFHPLSAFAIPPT